MDRPKKPKTPSERFDLIDRYYQNQYCRCFKTFNEFIRWTTFPRTSILRYHKEYLSITSGEQNARNQRGHTKKDEQIEFVNIFIEQLDSDKSLSYAQFCETHNVLLNTARRWLWNRRRTFTPAMNATKSDESINDRLSQLKKVGHDKVYIETTPLRGRTLKAKVAIPKDAIICYYTTKVYKWKGKEKYEGIPGYTAMVGDYAGVVKDYGKVDDIEFGIFANDPLSEKGNNSYLDLRNKVMVLIANRDIVCGEEVGFLYGWKYWEEHFTYHKENGGVEAAIKIFYNKN